MVAVRRAVRRLAETGRVRAIYEYNKRSVDGVPDSLPTITRLDVNDVHCANVGREVPVWITLRPDTPEKERDIPDWVTPEMTKDAERRTVEIQELLLKVIEDKMLLEQYEHHQRLLDLQKQKAFLEERLAERGRAGVSSPAQDES